MSCIWISEERKNNQYVDFTDSFECFESELLEDDKYTVKISADSQYELWINGKFINCGQYADYPSYRVYDEFDITGSVTFGKNIIFIRAYCQGRSSSTYVKGQPYLFYNISRNGETEAESGTHTLCSSDPCYKSGEMEMVSGQLGYAFEFNGSLNTYNWSNAVTVPDPKESFIPRPIKKLDIKDRINSKIFAQGVYMIHPDDYSSTTANKIQHAYLSAKLLENITSPSVQERYTLTPDGNNIHFKTQLKGNEEGIYLIFDLGREEAGYFDIEISAAKGTAILIGYGEHLDDLRVRASVGGRCFTGKYICSGENHEKFTHYTKRMGLRYLQLLINSNDFTLHYAGIKPAEYPVSDKGRFECSDSLHNKIYDVSVRTLQLCMHEHYEDCPWREQALYAMDSRNQILCGYYAFGEYDFPRESIRLLGMGLKDDGLLELCAPAEVSVTIPSFSLMWVTELYEYVLYSGDIEFGGKMFPVAEKIVRSFWQRSHGRDILKPLKGPKMWNFYEWSALNENSFPDNLRDWTVEENYDAPLTCFYAIALTSISKLAKILLRSSFGETEIDYRELSNWYEMLYKGVCDSFHDTFWDDQKQVYATYVVNGKKVHYAELTNSLALYAGLVPVYIKQKVGDILTGNRTIEFTEYETQYDVDPVTSIYPKYLVPVTLSYTVFKYEALMNLGGKYANYVIKDIEDKWGYMLYNNATSFWETINGSWDFSNAGSLCHGWSAVPCFIYFKYILGIRPSSPGFETYDCTPVKTDILKAKGTMNFPDGTSKDIKIG